MESVLKTLACLHICVFLLFVRLCYSVNYGGTVIMCSNTRVVVSSSIVLMNRHFPRQSLMTNCTCRFSSGSGSLKLVAGTLANLNKNESAFLLYRSDRGAFSISSSENLQRMPHELSGDVRVFELRIGREETNSIISMCFIIQNNASSDINVDCEAEYEFDVTRTTTNDPSTTAHAPGIVGAVASVTSPELVIILSCTCAVLLVIILITSVILCCVMPQKQRAAIMRIRDSAVISSDTYVQGTDFVRPESRIYSNTGAAANAGGGQVELLAVPAPAQHFPDRSSSFYQNVAPNV